MTPLTRDLVARAVPPAPEEPRPPVEEARMRAEMAVFLRDHPPGHGLWVFAYGALMWRRGIASPDIAAPARLPGLARRYDLVDLRDRGTPSAPGLTLGLSPAPGLACPGLLLHLPARRLPERLWPAWEQEAAAGFYEATWREAVILPSGARLRCLAFVTRERHPLRAGEPPVPEVAEVLSRAAGPGGAAADYLLRAVEELRAHGLRDALLGMLEIEVAARLRARLAAGVRPAA